MTVRNLDANLVQIIRNLQEDIKQLKANVGSSRLNSIRLDNWVLEAVDDSLVQMTNLTTGEVSFIGGVSTDTTVETVETYNEIVFSRAGLWSEFTVATSDSVPTWTVPNSLTVQNIVIAHKSSSLTGGLVGVRVYTANAGLVADLVTTIGVASPWPANDGYYLFTETFNESFAASSGDVVWIEKTAQLVPATVKDVVVTLQWS